VLSSPGLTFVLWVVLACALLAKGVWTLATGSRLVGATWLLIGFGFAASAIFGWLKPERVWWNQEQD
jgi:hypothetical protein